MRNKWLKSFFLTPHVWLAAAAISVAGSFVVDYVEAQKVADRALALRQGPPPSVALQNFRPLRDVGPAREVRVWAEAQLSNPVVVNLGSADAPQRAIMIPLYPLSDLGAERIQRMLVDGQDGGVTRPTPRPMPSEIETTVAQGMLVHLTEKQIGPDDDVTALINRQLGRGQYGQVVEVNGERTDPGELSLVAKGVMAAQNGEITDDYLAIAPYKYGRVVALAPPPSTGLQRALFWGGVALALGAIMLSVKTIDVMPNRGGQKSGAPEQRMTPGQSDKARERFQSLPTQDELYAAKAATAEPSPSNVLLTKVTHKFKNRR
ncbi:MAG: hypothetical protein HRU32_06735 [Rhodobacteraceae bacterium]|nr:hypothetical protein [Paracoccaceae bacterium]